MSTGPARRVTSPRISPPMPTRTRSSRNVSRAQFRATQSASRGRGENSTGQVVSRAAIVIAKNATLNAADRTMRIIRDNAAPPVWWVRICRARCSSAGPLLEFARLAVQPGAAGGGEIFLIFGDDQRERARTRPPVAALEAVRIDGVGHDGHVRHGAAELEQAALHVIARGDEAQGVEALVLHPQPRLRGVSCGVGGVVSERDTAGDRRA